VSFIFRCALIFVDTCAHTHFYSKSISIFRFLASCPDDVSSHPDAPLSIFPAVQTTCHTVWKPDRPKHHPSGRRGFPSGHSSVSRSFCSSLHPSRHLSSPSGRPSVFDQASDFLSKSAYGKIAATVRKTWIPVQTRYSLKASSQFKLNRPDAGLPWSGHAYNRYGNCVQQINHPNVHPPLSGRAKP
jgi:hypothetical protein